jgi:hypothetical protein
MKRLTTTSCVRPQSEIYCIPSVTLRRKKLKYHARIVEFSKGLEASTFPLMSFLWLDINHFFQAGPALEGTV